MKHYYPPIGVIQSCFREKFGVPRQSLMIDEATGILKLEPDSRNRAALQRLEEFSHIWVIFVFHRNGREAWRPVIDPPRQEAIKSLGVFATRSPHRPNPIGMSAVKLERIDYEAVGGIEIHLSGIDLLDGTPVLDIKPYLPYADRIDGANSGWAKSEIKRYAVSFSDQSVESLERIASPKYPRAKQLIEQMLEWDPRPTSQRRSVPMESIDSEGARFAFRVLDFDVKWEILSGAPHVLDVIEIESDHS